MINRDYDVDIRYAPDGPGDPCDDGTLAEANEAVETFGEHRGQATRLVKAMAAFVDRCVPTDQCVVKFADDNGHLWHVQMTLEFPENTWTRPRVVPRLVVIDAARAVKPTTGGAA
jgi:hypothetical protein